MGELKRIAYVSKKHNITVKNCNTFDVYGGTWWRQEGMWIHVHIGVTGLTANNQVDIAIIPSEVAPEHLVSGHGISNHVTTISTLYILDNGKVALTAEETAAAVDCYYLKKEFIQL